MVDLKFIRQNPEAIRKAIQEKKVDLSLDALLSTDETVLSFKKQLQTLEEEKNSNAKKVAQTSPQERTTLIERGRTISQKIEEIKPQLLQAEEKLQEFLWLVPNIPAPEAPRGLTEEDNVQIKQWGTPRSFDFPPLDHVEILDQHHWAELERIAKIAGSRSYSLRNEMVLLEAALHRFALEHLRAKGFQLITVPAIPRSGSLSKTL